MTIFSQIGTIITNKLNQIKASRTSDIATADSRIDTLLANPVSGGAKLVWKGGPVSHSIGTGWATMPLDKTYIAPNSEYVTISGATMTIKKAGYYHLNGYVLQHQASTSHRYLQIVHNDVNKQYRLHYNLGGGWSTQKPDYARYFNLNDRLYIKCYLGATGYRWHGSSTNYSVMTLTYLGGN